MGTSTEQEWQLEYQAACQLEQSSTAPSAGVISAFAKAYDILPSRLEPVAHLCRIYRGAGDHQTAYELARLWTETPRPPPDAPFLEPHLYDVVLPIELLMAAQAIGRVHESSYVLRYLACLADQPPAQFTIEGPVDIELPLQRIQLQPLSSVGPTLPAECMNFLIPGWWEL